MKFNLKSLLLASVLSVCAVSANAADVKEIKVGVVGDYVAQWDTVNEILKKDNLKVSTCKFDVNKVSLQISRRSIFSRNGKELDAVDAMFNLITILNHYEIRWTYGYKDPITTRPDLTKILIDIADIDQLSFLIKSYTQQKVII